MRAGEASRREHTRATAAGQARRTSSTLARRSRERHQQPSREEVMETLNAIEDRQQAARQRAWQFQNVTNELDRCRALVGNVQPHIDAIAPIQRLVGELQDLTAQLPRDLSGTASCIARDQIQATTLAAVKSLGHRRDRLQRQLDPALAKIPGLEKQVEEFKKS
jgi:hypothetical protein